MAQYLDGITLTWAVLLLFYGSFKVKSFTPKIIVAGISISLYIIAQLGWTAAFISGSIWGAASTNYIWFLFNTSVMLYITMSVRK